MNILIINGPNLNLLGKRQTDIYGTRSFDEYIEELKQLFPQHTIEYYQSNHEGAIIDRLHSDGFTADAIRSISTPVIEVHISNIYAREDYRRISYIANACRGSILGFGLDSYRLAIEAATHL